MAKLMMALKRLMLSLLETWRNDSWSALYLAEERKPLELKRIVRNNISRLIRAKLMMAKLLRALCLMKLHVHLLC